MPKNRDIIKALEKMPAGQDIKSLDEIHIPPFHEREGNRTGETWHDVNWVCPMCRQNTVIGYPLVDEQGHHMHTRFFCTFWPSNNYGPDNPATGQGSVTRPCGWNGWTLPDPM